ncbi:MAG: hypothetical protein V4723_14325 [Pseudomonadota bacterium]
MVNSVKQAPRFPASLTTARAAVLAVLLSSDDMTGMESIFDGRKTALNTVIRALKRKYGWPIELRSFPSNTADGRGAWATVFSIPQDVIDAAMEAGGRDWLEGYFAAKRSRAGRSTRSARPLR